MLRMLEFVRIRDTHEVKGTGRNQTFKKMVNSKMSKERLIFYDCSGILYQ